VRTARSCRKHLSTFWRSLLDSTVRTSLVFEGRTVRSSRRRPVLGYLVGEDCKGRDRVLRETLKPQQRSSRAGVRISYNDDRIHLPQTRACCSLDAKQLDDHREYVFHLSCWITIPLYYQQKPPPFRVVRQRRSCHYREGYCGNKTTGHGIS